MKKTKQILSFAGVPVLILMVLAGCGKEEPRQSAQGSNGTALTAQEEFAARSGGVHIGTPENVGPRPYSESTVYYGSGAAWDSFNPYDTGTMYSLWIIDKIFDHLAVTSAGGLIVKPRAADSWESADGGKAIIFHLNPNSKWHDGVPVTAHDWVFTVNLISNPETVLSSGNFFRFLEGTDQQGKALFPGSPKAEALDDHTLKLTFKNITIPEDFLVTQRNFIAFPEHLLKDVNPAELRSAEFWKNPVGSGPCIFESELVGSQVVMKANREYHLGQPGFGTLIYNVVANSNLFSSFLAGDIDIFGFGNMVNTEERQIAEQAGFTVADALAKTSFSEIKLNAQTITSPEIRQALHYAVDKEAISQSRTFGAGIPAAVATMPGSEYFNTSIKVERDVEKARELLKKGAYDGRVYTFVADQGRADAAAICQQNWAEIGFKIDIVVTDAASMLAGFRDGKYDIAIIGHSATADPLWYLSLVKGSDANGPRDPAYDILAEEIQKELDPEKRKKLIWEFQDYVFAQTPWIPLYHQGPKNVISKTLAYVDYNAGQMISDNAWEWYKP
ncbi:MAG: ABC transporter substrate-binding protein [Treponema sp.]|jgi:peptide/nickel transport system substrate-binding protein|nr:ABC transporter substrate-binding protein [Treponema sp.]